MKTSTDWSKFAGFGYTFAAEANFDTEYGQRWIRSNMHIPIIISVLYVVAVFGGRYFMQYMKPFNLRTPLFIWSLLLAIFSVFGTLRTLPEFLSTLRYKGFVHSICSNSFNNDVRVSFWIWLFIWSKVAEVVDTAFVILRKQKFIHLHWIHHALTLDYAFLVFGYLPGFTRWLVAMNFFVHSFMYSYYALRAIGVKTPQFVSIMITASQILQMVVGFVVCCTAYVMFLKGNKCENTHVLGIGGVLIYALFLILFVNFFNHTYLTKNKVNVRSKRD